jgi:hypothetical protein
VLLTMTAVDFGRLFYTYEAIANAAREGARYCAVFKDSAGASSRALGELSSTVPSATVATSPACIFGSSGSTLYCDSTPVTATSGSPVILCVSATFQPITPLVDAAVGITNGGSIALNASAVMMVP